MVDEGGAPRPHARTLVEALAALGPEAPPAAGRRRDAIFMQQAPPDGDEGRTRRRVETHAWIEALLPGEGEPVCVPADPTHRTLGGELHVKVGHGRHSADVPPINGVFRGAGGAELSASVKMTRAESSPVRS